LDHLTGREGALVNTLPKRDGRSRIDEDASRLVDKRCRRCDLGGVVMDEERVFAWGHWGWMVSLAWEDGRAGIGMGEGAGTEASTGLLLSSCVGRRDGQAGCKA
jgi:hypothetical protein